MATPKWRSVRVLIALALGMLVSGVGVAMAASFGSSSAGRLGADNVAVAACAPSINLQWANGSTSPVLSTAPTATSATFRVSNIFLSNLTTTCNGQPYRLAVASTVGATLTPTISGTITGAPAIMTVALPSAIDTKSIGQVVLVIYQ